MNCCYFASILVVVGVYDWFLVRDRVCVHCGLHFLCVGCCKRLRKVITRDEITFWELMAKTMNNYAIFLFSPRGLELGRTLVEFAPSLITGRLNNGEKRHWMPSFSRSS
ncbi:hypothetical protein QVD17_15284 [Tagetes erecta]|uniref:Uncharacterized protein n=1 Tax=Tagetes erecta TaxID=13708 RepID=A0AAD8KS38_TARER|nr:hypothetical protein QVD17_15284 [Tagetes erecta]